jgi:tagatose 6-phosphate kinase
MLLVVCPNLAIDRILQVDGFQALNVQRSRPALIQPGGKGSNVARVFRQLGEDVALIGFVGRRDGGSITGPLRRVGVMVDAITAYEGETRTCTIICDPFSRKHPTVVNEESPSIEAGSVEKLLAKVEKWIPRVKGVLTTGSISTGLPDELYAEVLDRARSRGKITSIDATGAVLRAGLLARPTFMKPNAEEFRQLVNSSSTFVLPPHTAMTFGKAGACLMNEGKCLYGAPPQVYDTNPIGSGDAFAAGYLKYLLHSASAPNCFRWAMAAAACDANTLMPGFVDVSQVRRLASQVELRYSSQFA